MYADGITYFDKNVEKYLFVFGKEDELYEVMLKPQERNRKIFLILETIVF